MIRLLSTFRTALAIAAIGLSTALYAVENTSQKIFNPSFRTLKVEKEGDFMAAPVIALGSGEKIIVSFDEIAEDYSTLQYRLIHCNADWQPSRLMESEYLDGFNYTDIEDYAFSQNTYIHFVNYRIAVPSDECPILMSGNYLLQVFPQDDPDDTILQVRFQVSEQSASVHGYASGRTDIGINTEWQQVAFEINTPQSVTSDPYNDLIVYITQNNRPETTRRIMRPLRMMGNTLTYESMPELIFPAGNEYRRFETVRVNYPGMHVDSLRYMGNNYHAWLATDYGREGGNYTYDQTQHGRFMTDEYNSTEPALGADYVTVHFSLDFPQLMDGDVYVQGELTGYDYTERNRMEYNAERGLYELQLPLKQGSYNYQYVARKSDGSGEPDATLIEGNYAETSNEYLISVYLRTPASRGDRLISSVVINN